MLVELEELELHPSVNDAPDTTHRGGHAEGGAEQGEAPVEVPAEAEPLRLLDTDPHEAWVGERHRQRQAAQQAGEAGEERQSYADEERDEAVEDPEPRPDPDRAGPVGAARVVGLEAVEDRHGVYLEAAEAVEHDEEERRCEDPTGDVVAVEDVEGGQDPSWWYHVSVGPVTSNGNRKDAHCNQKICHFGPAPHRHMCRVFESRRHCRLYF